MYLSLFVSLSLSSQGHQRIVRVMSFQNMYSWLLVMRVCEASKVNNLYSNSDLTIPRRRTTTTTILPLLRWMMMQIIKVLAFCLLHRAPIQLQIHGSNYSILYPISAPLPPSFQVIFLMTFFYEELIILRKYYQNYLIKFCFFGVNTSLRMAKYWI